MIRSANPARRHRRSTVTARVIETFPNGALIETPTSVTLPMGKPLTFRCDGYCGTVVVDATSKNLDLSTYFYSVTPTGSDCECRPAHPWFEGARWVVQLPPPCD